MHIYLYQLVARHSESKVAKDARRLHAMLWGLCNEEENENER